MNLRIRHPKRLLLASVVSALALAGALVVGGQVAQAGQGRGGSDTPAPPPPPIGVSVHARQEGMPVLPVRAELAAATGAHFTEADVMAYFAGHRPSYAVAAQPAPVVVGVQFESARDANAQLGTSINVPDDTLLCVVRLTGTFLGDTPPGIKAYVYHDGHMVFDAHTGNLLVSSVGVI